MNFLFFKNNIYVTVFHNIEIKSLQLKLFIETIQILKVISIYAEYEYFVFSLYIKKLYYFNKFPYLKY